MIPKNLRDQILRKLYSKQVDKVVVHPAIEYDGEIRFIEGQACMLLQHRTYAMFLDDLSHLYSISPFGIGEFMLGIPVIQDMPESKIFGVKAAPVAVSRGSNVKHE